MTSNTLRLLCLYAFFGNPTESKLAALKGRRSYSSFLTEQAKVVLSVFSPAIPEGTSFKFIKYINDVQTDYHAKLIAFGVKPSKKWIDPEGKSAAVSLLQTNHEALCEMDKTEHREDFRYCYDMCHSCSQLGDAIRLKDHLIIASKTYEAWIVFSNKISAAFPGVGYLTQNPNVAVGELMAFLTHISRAVVFHYRDEPKDAKDDFDACLRHVKRGVLDLHKAILAVSFQLHLEKTKVIPEVTAKVLGLCSARHDELKKSASKDSKLDLFIPLVNEHLDFHGISEIIPTLQSLRD